MSDHVTRRDVVVAGLAAVASTQFSGTAAAQTTRTRYSATSPLGKANLKKYAAAVKLMKQLRPTDPRSWQFQAYTHWIPGPLGPWDAVIERKQDVISQIYRGFPPENPYLQAALDMWNTCQAHSCNKYDPNFFREDYFFPWHRYYVWFLEEICRAVLEDNTFTLPYWDYVGGDESNASLPEEFRKPGDPLYGSLYDDTRFRWVNNGDRIDKDNHSALNLKAFDQIAYIDASDKIGFCPQMDINPHGVVHALVGGDMYDIQTAANDPILYLHHCNLDRLWQSWNLLPDRVNPVWWQQFPAERMFAFVRGDRTEVLVWPFMANNVALFNYQYDKYYVPADIPRVTVMNNNPLATIHSLAATRATTRAAASAAVALDSDRVTVSLAPSFHLASPARNANANVWTPPPANRGLYLVLSGIEVHTTSSSTYNVYLNVPDGAAPTGTGEPGYVGTFSLFGAGGHTDHCPGEKGHGAAFNVTKQIPASQTGGPPKVTFVRRGPDRDTAHPTVGQVLLVES
jgi:tyrosinase